MSKPDLMQLAADERRDLADFLVSLEPEQWDAPTLCDEWSVRQVAAHVVSYDALGLTGIARRMVKGRFRVDRMNLIGVTEFNGRSPTELVGLVREHVRPRGLTAGFGSAIALTDGMIHHQDIRRALDIPRTVPAARVVSALGFALKALALPSRRNVRGLALVATDLDWSHGDGPEVMGTGEALLMTIAGRPAALAELDGPGVATLTGRMRDR